MIEPDMALATLGVNLGAFVALAALAGMSALGGALLARYGPWTSPAE